METKYPNFESAAFLNAHIHDTLGFYEPRIYAPEGGFYGCFLDDGTCYDPKSRHLVASARYVLNYATAYEFYGTPKYKAWAEWGLDFLQNTHRQENGHYAWLIEDGEITDKRVMAYGHAFVLLAAASCVKAGIGRASEIMETLYDFIETYFWDDTAHAYFDERDDTLQTLSAYRGQNANMHMCEALLAAYQASGDMKYLNRAEMLTNKFAFDLAAQSGGQIWEHYDANWNVDMNFNIDKPNDRYKPWGFQPGHQTEWTKLLLILNEVSPHEKWVQKAESLYNKAIATGWDEKFGGIAYGVAPNGGYCASEKYFWVQSESFAAAWRLYLATGEEKYRDDYNRIWRWSWDHMIDHEYGAWFRVRGRDGAAMNNKKSPFGKTDYHTMGACWDVLAAQKVKDKT